MECPHAYLERNIDYVLCNKEPKPNPYDRKALFHSVCAHQAECPKQNCHKLTASWIKCVKLAEANQRAYDEVFDEGMPTHESAPQKRSRRSKASQNED